MFSKFDLGVGESDVEVDVLGSEGCEDMAGEADDIRGKGLGDSEREGWCKRGPPDGDVAGGLVVVDDLVAHFLEDVGRALSSVDDGLVGGDR
jgi:hypothetical protein